MSAVQCFDTGLWLDGDQWLARWTPNMDPDEWEDARREALAVFCPPAPALTLAQILTLRAQQTK